MGGYTYMMDGWIWKERERRHGGREREREQVREIERKIYRLFRLELIY